MGKHKKMKKEVKLHQHIDYQGHKFGHWHPEDAQHKKEQTQQFHINTLVKVNNGRS